MGWGGAVFPSFVGMAWPIPRTVELNTIKHEAISGKNIRIANWSYPKYHYEVPQNYLRLIQGAAEWPTLEGFFNSVSGPAGLWGYNDPNDNTATNQTFGTGDGATTTFQLIRAFGGFNMPVFLINGTPTVNVAGSPTSSFTLSPYGAVVFASAPAASAALTWSGNFYMPCQFDEDTMIFENFMSQLARVKSIKFSTAKLP
jgi:uncharacterized protein (TIGR02217 family)